MSGPGHTLPRAASSQDWETTGLGVWSGSGCPGLGVTPRPHPLPPYSQVHCAGGWEDRAVPGPEPPPDVQRLVHCDPRQHEEGKQLPMASQAPVTTRYSLQALVPLPVQIQDMAPGFVLGRPLSFPPFLPLSHNYSSCDSGFPTQCPKPGGYDSPDSGRSAQCPLGVHLSLTGRLWSGFPSR